MIRLLVNRLVHMAFDRVVVVIGHKGEMVMQELSDCPVSFVWQREQLGTGHAVMMARDELGDFDGTTLVAAGDVPFLSVESIERLFATHRSTQAAATCLSAVFDDPTGYGRIIRDGATDSLVAIVEHKDASEEIRRVREINSGTFCFDNRLLFEVVNEIGSDNAQGEYYLTDAVKLLHDRRLRVSVVAADDPDEVRGVNSVEQLEELAHRYAHRA